MSTLLLVCIALLVIVSLTHLEALTLLSLHLPHLKVPSRAKVMVAVAVLFCVHAVEIGTFGLGYWWLVDVLRVGGLAGPEPSTIANCLYFSAETYTSLGFGDITPVGPIRLMAGVEALVGLLLIGWSASYLYLAMERFWADDEGHQARHRRAAARRARTAGAGLSEDDPAARR
jgi:hypothetical protein